MITRWHVEGRILPHERVRIYWQRRSRAPYLAIILLLMTPWLLGPPGTPQGYHTRCGVSFGPPPHSAWVRCMRQQIERQRISDFPMLRYLSSLTIQYQVAAENQDLWRLRVLELELLDMLQDD